MKPIVFFRKFHKWLGLIIGIQVLFWAAGGFVMTFFDIEEVRGEHTMAQPVAFSLDDGQVSITANQALQQIDFAPESITLKGLLGKPVWVATNKEQQAIVDATTGKKLSPLDKSLARQVALADFSGQGELAELTLLSEELGEVRGKGLPIWQAQFNDSDNTRVYISPYNGEVVARRNDTWRVFDFFWMLHIMDYKNRTDFNHPLVVFAAFLALFMTLSGLYLVIKVVFLKRKRTSTPKT
ncbi:PepSY domain-containing protein [Kangiella koreensis]|uniref:PepSY-associated TM helix n=1 Tax=Kangiella koreensis (strain DSM 16069 / JCM 12317 / KCTC 12182 / SW-125) TaxID=523791 RepID=C7R8Y8_KANKD|nr:PepSY domain-containing protein [Kangiella koreensis]ACV26001.1 PepSY-associated TM helix [Kangiella koreensis DSM 16069]